MANDEADPTGSTAGPGDPQAVPTVLERMAAARIDPQRARVWLDSRLVRVDGVPVTDPDAPAPPPARVVLTAS